MVHNRHSRFSLYLIIFISWLTLMVSCTISPQERPADSLSDNPVLATPAIQSTEEEPVSVLKITITPTMATNVQETVIQTPIVVTESTEQPTPTATPRSTVTPLSSPTHAPEPSPTAVTIECQNTGTLPEQVIPTSVNMDSVHITMSTDTLYLAVDQYVAKFDISSPEFPEFLGFWQIPDVLDISDIVVNNGIVYISSGSTIQAMNASPQCQFETISYLSIPLQIIRLELEDDRLYAGGISDGEAKREVAILSLDNISQPEELGIVDIGQESAIWSIFEETLYSLSGDKFAVTDVSDPRTPSAQPVNLTLDADVLRYTPNWFVKDTLYMLWGSDTLTIIRDLKATSPTVIRQDDFRYILIDVFQVQDEYIFLGVNRCEIECASSVWILDAADGEEISSVSLHPHYPVYDYQEMGEDLIYAFSGDSLLVVDISNREEPEIINEVQFIR